MLGVIQPLLPKLFLGFLKSHFYVLDLTIKEYWQRKCRRHVFIWGEEVYERLVGSIVAVPITKVVSSWTFRLNNGGIYVFG
jgi:hypothetical protein